MMQSKPFRGAKRVFLFLIFSMPLVFGYAQVQVGGNTQGTLPTFLYFDPAVTFPLGDSVNFYTLSAGGNAGIRFMPGVLDPFFFSAAIGYENLATQALKPLSLLNASGGFGVHFNPMRFLTLEAFATAGYAGGLLDLRDGSTLYGSAFRLATDLSVRFNFTDDFGLSVGGRYLNAFGLYQGLGFNLGVQIGLSAAGGQASPAKIQIQSPSISPIFPIFYKYYDTNKIGTVDIINKEPGPISKVRVSFYVNSYMDRPKFSEEIPEMKTGTSATVPLYALLKETVLSVVEETASSGIIAVDYTFNGTEKHATLSQTITVRDRNSMVWDDTRRAAAFISAKDPVVLDVARNAISDIRGYPHPVVNDSVRNALTAFETLRVLGVTYVVDPNSAYESNSKNPEVVDYLQFPRQTLSYRTGDCDDLSILYSAMLESLGVQTAFITVPGHIFLAFDTGLTPTLATKFIGDKSNLIIKDDHVWMPIEITLLSSGFNEAWKTGAREWRQYAQSDQAEFVNIHDAWNTYQPVGLNSSSDQLPKPIVFDEKSLVKTASTSLDQFTTMQLKTLEAAIIAAAPNKSSPSVINAIGVLYARYGDYERAKKEFQKLVSTKSTYAPAAINLGNISFLEKDYTRALSYLTQADKVSPKNSLVMIAIAKVDYELGKLGTAASLYKNAVQIDPGLDGQFGYLAGIDNSNGSRAADAAEQGSVLWND